MAFEIRKDNFILNGSKHFLNSGEIHYFRIEKKLWDVHLSAAKEAGLTTVSTYIPWDFHEPEEGVFDFWGKTLPERDLDSWVKKCAEHGMNCILKPGPFILAEYRGAGLPEWFLKKHTPDIKMHDSAGNPVSSDGISLFYSEYLEKVEKWYDQIMPFIAEREISKGGNVILMQICNEIGVFQWLAHQADYNETTLLKFIKYLENKNPDISYWNKLWKTNFLNFENITLPPDGKSPYQSVEDRGRDYEWHLFWRTYFAEYLNMLTEMARKRGVTIPFYHNLPGWIYGNGYEFPVNITMYEELFQNKSDIIFGIDHIPEFFSYRNLHDDRIINDITFAMQGNKPLFAAEFQCGSREFHVVTNNTEMELFYKASIANGLKGWNYYMFSQGKNPERKGYSGELFYWFNPLNYKGEKTNAFHLVQRMNKIISTIETPILESKRNAKIAVLFYSPYYSTELERPTDEKSEVVFNYSAIRRPAYFDGLLKILQILNIEYDMLDLNATNAEEMKNYQQIWAFSTDEMNASEQQKIVDYTKNGGNTVIFPNLPVREMNGNPCKILRDFVGVDSKETYSFDSPLLDILGFKDIKCANPQIVFNENELINAEIIAKNIDGKICGFSKNLGNGKLVHLGTWLGFDTEKHREVYSQLVKNSGAEMYQANSNCKDIITRQRFAENGSGILFVGNYYNESHFGNITYKHPKTNENITIPYTKSGIEIPETYGILTPLNFKLSENLALLHTTSDILKIDQNFDGFSFTLFGNRDLLGEIVLEGEDISNIKKIVLNDQEVNFEIKDNRLIINYNHLHKKEFLTSIKF